MTKFCKISTPIRSLTWFMLLAFAQPTCSAQNVSITSPPHKALYGFSSQVNRIAFRPGSTDLAVALYGTQNGGKTVICRSWLNKQKKDTILDVMPTPCFSVAFNADGTRLAWCSWTAGKQIRLVSDHGQFRALNCGDINVTAIAFDPKTKSSIASVATDGSLKIWNSDTGHLLRRLPTGKARGLCVAYSSDGQYLAASFKNGSVLLWATDALDKPPAALENHADQVNYLAFAPNSHILATASAERTVAFWDCKTGSHLRTLEQQNLDPVVSMAFSSDGRYLATGDRSGRVVFWSMTTYRPIVGFYPHRQPVYGLAFNSDDGWLATGSQDRTVKFFATKDIGFRRGRVRVLAAGQKVNIKVDGAQAELDERSALSLLPGAHQLLVSSEDGSNSKTFSVQVEQDEETTLAAEVKSAFGKLTVVTERPSNVVLSNPVMTKQSQANQTIERLPPGSYTLRINPKDSRYASETRTVEVAAGESTRITAELRLAYGDSAPPSDPVRVKQTRINLRDGAEMVWIPAGTFTMGSKNGDRDAKPPHLVTLSGYWIYSRPVTVAQYEKFCRASKGTPWEHQMPDTPSWGWNDDHPIVRVSWDDARDYSRWAFADETKVFLPTEAQFERAAQGPEAYEYPWGDTWDAALCINSVRPYRPGGTKPVAMQAPNGFGLYDAAGNVWEWCQDLYGANYYKSAPGQDPSGPLPGAGKMRVMRGGGWDVRSSKPFRTHARGRSDPSAQQDDIGFRCAASGS